MKLLILIGDSAVGKMTVGQELMKITQLRLFHNHMAIEPVLEIFGEKNNNAILGIRDIIFQEFAKSDCYGMIFTYMWPFDRPESWAYIEHIKEIFHPYQTEFYYVELVASQTVRLERNATENRLRQKPSKRNISLSNERLIKDDQTWRYVSYDGEIPFKNYIKIDNSNLSAKETAQKIQKHFSL